MIYGPLASDFSSMDRLNESSSEIWGMINGSAKEVPETAFYAFCDVRDGMLRTPLY